MNLRSWDQNLYYAISNFFFIIHELHELKLPMYIGIDIQKKGWKNEKFDKKQK